MIGSDGRALPKRTRTHADDAPKLKCRFSCGFYTRRRDHLAVHERLHTEKKGYLCKRAGCSYLAVSERDAERHMDRRHGNERACGRAGCWFRTTDKRQLQAHRRSHAVSAAPRVAVPTPVAAELVPATPPATPYACREDRCDFRSQTKSGLMAHERRHTGAKPFACAWPDCDVAVSEHWELTAHMRVHMRKPGGQ